MDDVGAGVEGDVDAAHQVKGGKEGGHVKGHRDTEAPAFGRQSLHGPPVLAKDDAADVGGVVAAELLGLLRAPMPRILDLTSRDPSKAGWDMTMGPSIKATHTRGSPLVFSHNSATPGSTLDDVGHSVLVLYLRTKSFRAQRGCPVVVGDRDWRSNPASTPGRSTRPSPTGGIRLRDRRGRPRKTLRVRAVFVDRQ